MAESMRSLVLRTGAARLGAALVYSRLTGRPALYPAAPLAMMEFAAPKLLPGGWTRVRPTLAGICGSDLKTLRLDISTRAANQARRRAGSDAGGMPRFLGHETVGEIVEASSGCAWAAPGQRVVMIPRTTCAVFGAEPCEHCRAGHSLLCVRRDDTPPRELFTGASGGGWGGGWSDQFVRHESQLFRLPSSITDEQAVLFDPLACALHCVLRRPPVDGESVLVIGAGAIGLAVVKVLTAIGRRVRVAVLARHDFQAAAAQHAGAELVSRHEPADAYDQWAKFLGTSVAGHRRHNRCLETGFHVVYDTVGSASTLHHALRWTRPRGAVVVEGVNLFPGVLDRTPIWHRELSILGALGHGEEEFEGRRAHTFDFIYSWLQEGRLDASGLLTHEFPFDQYRRAILTAAGKHRSGAIKVAMRFAAR